MLCNYQDSLQLATVVGWGKLCGNQILFEFYAVETIVCLWVGADRTESRASQLISFDLCLKSWKEVEEGFLV